MSQVYCTTCEAPLEYGATDSGLCPKCERGSALHETPGTAPDQIIEIDEHGVVRYPKTCPA
jgi:hypothetical protein